MGVGFVAYIDESGDTGIERVKGNRLLGVQSEWLILGCMLVRVENDAQVPSWKREIKSQFRNDRRPDLHFSNLLPMKKTIACRTLATKPCRLFVVMSNKKNIEDYRNANLDPNNKAWIYWFLTRLLLERVTEFCERTTPKAERGHRSLRIVFARRGGLRYGDFVAYMRKLRRQSRAGTLVLRHGDLRWSLIDFDEIRVLEAVERDGLQLADIAAGAFFYAVERNRPAACDPQYAQLLRAVIAKDAYGHQLGFGIKTMPMPHEMNLWPQQRAIFDFYGYDQEGWQAPGS